MKPLYPYSFSKEVAKKLGKTKFIRKHRANFPDLDMEKVWTEMFPKKSK